MRKRKNDKKERIDFVDVCSSSSDDETLCVMVGRIKEARRRGLASTSFLDKIRRRQGSKKVTSNGKPVPKVPPQFDLNVPIFEEPQGLDSDTPSTELLGELNSNVPVSDLAPELDSNVPNAKLPQKLDSNVFQCYLENIWKKFSEEKTTSFTYVDCLWFALYRKQETKEKVLKWIKEKHIFSRKYVFVPIVCWDHWSLLILCHLGESSKSKTRPCMLLLDSLKTADAKQIEPDIRRFVLDIYKEEARVDEKRLIERIPLLVPKVPQQKNGSDCGIFVLYFISLFVENAPESFNVSEGCPNFMNESWFNSESLDSFCEEVHTFSRRMSSSSQRSSKLSKRTGCPDQVLRRVSQRNLSSGNLVMLRQGGWKEAVNATEASKPNQRRQKSLAASQRNDVIELEA